MIPKQPILTLFILIFIIQVAEEMNWQNYVFDAVKCDCIPKTLNILTSKVRKSTEIVKQSDSEIYLITKALLVAARKYGYGAAKLMVQNRHFYIKQLKMVKAICSYPEYIESTALYYAASVGNLELVQMLVRDFNICRVSDSTLANSSPLCSACSDIWHKHFISQEACVNATTNYNSRTCLMVASRGDIKVNK